MPDAKITSVAGMDFYEGHIHDKDVVVVKCGIGKVNAAICTQILADRYKVDSVINTGVAGSLNSDIDICYEGEAPTLFTLVRIKYELEALLGRPVDLVRVREKMDEVLKQTIQEEAIYV